MQLQVTKINLKNYLLTELKFAPDKKSYMFLPVKPIKMNVKQP